MGTIYEIICWTTGLRYIGQTTQSLKNRLKKHKYDACSSQYVLEHGNYEIYQLEKVVDKKLLKERELYYIQHTDCVNKQKGEFDRKEYMKVYSQTNKYKELKKISRKSEKSKAYKQTEKYKEYHKAYMKEYNKKSKNNISLL